MEKGNVSAFTPPRAIVLLRLPLPRSLTGYVGRGLFRFLLTMQGLGAFERVLARTPVHRRNPPSARLGQPSNRYGQTRRKNIPPPQAGSVTGDLPGPLLHTVAQVGFASTVAAWRW